MWRIISYPTVNMLSSKRTKIFELCRETVSLYFDKNIKHINTLRRQNTKTFIIKAGDVFIQCCGSKG